MIYAVRSHEMKPGSICATQDDDIHQVSNLAADGGDLVTLQGKLVDVEIRDAGGAVAARMRTSLTRDDVGSGACEIVWVESVEVEK